MYFKDQLGLAMTQRNMTVPALAQAIGVSHQALRHWKDGRGTPTRAQLAMLEKALGIAFLVTHEPVGWRGHVYSPFPEVAAVVQSNADVRAAVHRVLCSIEAGAPMLGARVAAHSLERILITLRNIDR